MNKGNTEKNETTPELTPVSEDSDVSMLEANIKRSDFEKNQRLQENICNSNSNSNSKLNLTLNLNTKTERALNKIDSPVEVVTAEDDFEADYCLEGAQLLNKSVLRDNHYAEHPLPVFASVQDLNGITVKRMIDLLRYEYLVPVSELPQGRFRLPYINKILCISRKIKNGIACNAKTILDWSVHNKKEKKLQSKKLCEKKLSFAHVLKKAVRALSDCDSNSSLNYQSEHAIIINSDSMSDPGFVSNYDSEFYNYNKNTQAGVLDDMLRGVSRMPIVDREKLNAGLCNLLSVRKNPTNDIQRHADAYSRDFTPLVFPVNTRTSKRKKVTPEERERRRLQSAKHKLANQTNFINSENENADEEEKADGDNDIIVPTTGLNDLQSTKDVTFNAVEAVQKSDNKEMIAFKAKFAAMEQANAALNAELNQVRHSFIVKEQASHAEIIALRKTVQSGMDSQIVNPVSRLEHSQVMSRLQQMGDSSLQQMQYQTEDRDRAKWKSFKPRVTGDPEQSIERWIRLPNQRMFMFDLR